MVGHVAPEAAMGGPIAAVRDGDDDRAGYSVAPAVAVGPGCGDLRASRELDATAGSQDDRRAQQRLRLVAGSATG